MTTPPTPAEPLTDAELAEMRAVTDRATPGPWEYDGTETGHQITMATAIESPGRHEPQHLIEYRHELDPDSGDGQWEEASANCEFIAAARSWMPRLLSEVERLRAANAALEAKVKQQQCEIMELRTEVERGRV